MSVAKAVGAMHMDTRRGAASKLEHAHPSLGKIVVITLGVSDPHSVNRGAQGPGAGMVCGQVSFFSATATPYPQCMKFFSATVHVLSSLLGI